jgi:hypothetical protein
MDEIRKAPSTFQLNHNSPSMQEALRARRGVLRPATTVVSTASGNRYVEPKPAGDGGAGVTPPAPPAPPPSLGSALGFIVADAREMDGVDDDDREGISVEINVDPGTESIESLSAGELQRRVAWRAQRRARCGEEGLCMRPLGGGETAEGGNGGVVHRIGVFVEQLEAFERHFDAFAFLLQEEHGVEFLQIDRAAIVRDRVLDRLDAAIFPGGLIFDVDAALNDAGNSSDDGDGDGSSSLQRARNALGSLLPGRRKNSHQSADGDAEEDAVDEPFAGSAVVARAVRDGLGYVGICAGGFLAGDDCYTGCSNRRRSLVGAELGYVAGTGTAVVKPTGAAAEVFGSEATAAADGASLFFNNGPLFAPAATRNGVLSSDSSSADSFSGKIRPARELLRFTHLSTNKADASTCSAAIDAHPAAAVASDVGNGRVVVFGPHPEASGGVGAALVVGALRYVMRLDAPSAVQ